MSQGGEYMKRYQKTGPGRGQDGFSLLEMLIAVSILAIGLLGAAAMQISAIRGNYLAGHLTEGTVLAQDRMEFLMAQAYNNAAYFTVGNAQPDPNPPTPEGYNITYDVAAGATPNTYVLTIRVQWKARGVTRTSVIKAVRPMVMRDI
jgi:prepilin-type N-terminal cleavage/methylation domain-containing protein